MANGEYVTWNKYNEHLEDTKEGYARLERVEAEVMGDAQMGRPSLRLELGTRIDKTNKILKTIGVPILVAVLIKILIDVLFIQPTYVELKHLKEQMREEKK